MSPFHSAKALRGLRRLQKGVAIAVLSAALLCAEARAIDTVTLDIVAAGDVGAFIVDASTVRQDVHRLDLVLVDPRGSASGWSVSLSSDLTVVRLGRPLVLTGQAIAAAGPHVNRMRGASLIAPRIVLWADRGAGSGNYWQRVDVRQVTVELEIVVTVTVGLAP